MHHNPISDLEGCDGTEWHSTVDLRPATVKEFCCLAWIPCPVNKKSTASQDRAASPRLFTFDIIFLPEILSRLQVISVRSKRMNQPPRSALALSYRRIREAHSPLDLPPVHRARPERLHGCDSDCEVCATATATATPTAEDQAIVSG